MNEVLTPKFLTAKTAATVVDMVMQMLDREPIHSLLNIHEGGGGDIQLYIVILVPSVEDAREADYPNYPDYPIKPFVLYEYSKGDVINWPHKFDDIAHCKAQQLWRGQNTDGNTSSMPWLLFPDDTPWWGGVKRHGIVVACSGVQPHFDQMISGMIADGLKAFGIQEWEESADKKAEVNFLT